MPSHFIAIDLETTGLPPKLAPSAAVTDWARWAPCRAVQMAWIVYGAGGGDEAAPDTPQPVSTNVYIISPDGFAIPEQAAAIHGFTTERATSEGLAVRDVMEAFVETMQDYPDAVYVAHNMEFDAGVVAAELARAGMVGAAKAWVAAPKVCTMLANTRPGCRWPRLSVLYEEVFGRPMAGAHSADGDARACAEIYMARNRRAD
jgi:DNA polymerase-3 subunit alpha